MSSRVWPRAPRSGTNETSDVIDIDNSINGERGAEDNDNNDDNNNDDAINNDGGTAIPER